MKFRINILKLLKRKRIKHLALIIASMFVFISPALAQEAPQPGATCTGAESGQFRQIGGPEEAGGGAFVYCDGSTWKRVLGYNNSGITIPTLSNSQFTCPDGSILRYDAASQGMFCDVDVTPDVFAFVNQNDVARNASISSNIVTISGLAVDVPVSISGNGSPEFRINGGSWTTSGNIGNGDTLQLRLTSSPDWSTTFIASVTVGDATVNWSVTTLDEDLTPDAFNFTDLTLQEHNTLVTSNTITISGINSNPTVSVSGVGAPEIRINGGAWTTSGTITNGQTLQVRLTTANASATTRSATVDINGVSDVWNVTTKDITPAAFDFTNQSNRTINTWIYSNTETITGIDVATDVSISGSGAQFQIAGGSWVTSGTITNGQTLRLRLQTSGNFSTNHDTTVTVGTVSDFWRVTTEAQDTTPNAFSFTDQTMQPYNTLTTSNTITIGGINDSTPVSVTGDGSPQISINGGSWVTSGNITNGQTLRVRLTSANAASTTRSAIVNVGGVTDTWSVGTYDITPAAFDFTNQTNVAPSTWIYSNTVTLSGINTSTPVSITGGGQFQIAGGSWVTSGNITNGQTLRLRIYSSSAFSTAVSTTVSVGTVSDGWSVTTEAQDTTPDAYNFTNLTGQTKNMLVYSNTVTITGINDSTPVTISGTGSPQFSINGGSYTTSGNITNGQTLRLRLTSANADNTARSATVNVGGVTDGWSVTTEWTYSWYEGGNWSSCSGSYSSYGSWYYTAGCSVSCGGGTRPKRQDCNNNSTGSQTQTVECRRSDGTTVSDTYCSGTKPSATQSCTMPCQYGSYRTGSDSCNTHSCCTLGPTCTYSYNQPTDSCGSTYSHNGNCYTWMEYQVDGACVSGSQFRSAGTSGTWCSGDNHCHDGYGNRKNCGQDGWYYFTWSDCKRYWCR